MRSTFEVNTDIVDEEVSQVRARIGEELRLPSPFNTGATFDVIRHYAHGIGDDNPLWCDRGYATSQGHLGVLAPPTFPYSIFPPGVGLGFDGLQGFHGGSRWEFFSPIVEGTPISARAWLTGVDDVIGKRSGRMIIEHGLTEYRDDFGNLIATNASQQIRKPRPASGSKDAMKVVRQEVNEMSDEDLLALEEKIASYQRRGDLPRFWEEVRVGESIDTRFKGPLTIRGIFAFYIGIGYVDSDEISVRNRRRLAANPQEAPTHRPLAWQIDRVAPGAGHMDAKVAETVGMSAPYDNGWMRVAWMTQLITDWAGDLGQIKMSEVRVRLPNVVGDVLTLQGKVVSKSIESGIGRVDLDIEARRQDGEVSCYGTAKVELPLNGK